MTAPRRPLSRSGPEIVFDDPCVVFALRRESKPFCREFRPHQRFPGAPCWARFCGPAWLPVLAIETGVGPQSAERVMSWLLSRPKLGNVAYRPKAILAAGLCGGLREGYHAGDLVLATEVIDAASKSSWPTTWPGELPAGKWDPPLRRGRLVTVAQLAGSPEKKQTLANEFDAVAVDMESATLARLCHQAEVPFGCLRVVLDAVATPLSPQLVSLLSAGRVSALRLTLALLSAPSLIGELWRLSSESRFAADVLGKGLGELLTLTLPWMQE